MPTSAEIRREKGRIERALAWVQQRYKTPYHFDIKTIPAVVTKTDPDTVFTVSRSSREDNDKNSFVLEFNYQMASTMSRQSLRKLAVHEILHCRMWELAKRAQERGPAHEREWAKNEEESIVYDIQRWLVGDVP